MATHDEIIEALERAAKGHGPVSVERVQRAGMPLLWEQRISVTTNGDQRFETLRSSVDEGGSPIGRWSGRALPGFLASVARALLEVRPWIHSIEPVLPGQEFIEWQYAAGGIVGGLTVAGDSPQLFSLAKLDSLLRGVAADLMSAHHGVELICELVLDGNEAIIRFRNDGDQDGLIANPWRAVPGRDDYLRLEVGLIPQEQPGVTNLDVVYEPVSLEWRRPPTGPWADDFLLLSAGSALECPARSPVQLPSGVPCLLRAVYSSYGTGTSYAGLPVLRGRAFSRDLELGAA